jgi:hypothetical protein
VASVSKQDNKEKRDESSPDRRGRGGSHNRADRRSLDLARQRSRPAEVRAWRRPVRRRSAPGHRHRGSAGDDRRRTGFRDDLVRRHRACERQERDDPDRRRLLGDPHASRLDERWERRGGRRGRTRREDRPERRDRARRSLRPPRHSALRGSERLRRPSPLPAGAACCYCCARSSAAAGASPDSASAASDACLSSAACAGAGRRPRRKRASRRAFDSHGWTQEYAEHGAGTRLASTTAFAGPEARYRCDRPACSRRLTDRSGHSCPQRARAAWPERKATRRHHQPCRAQDGRPRTRQERFAFVQPRIRGAGRRPRRGCSGAGRRCRPQSPQRLRVDVARRIGARRVRARASPAAAPRLWPAAARAYHCCKCRATT